MKDLVLAIEDFQVSKIMPNDINSTFLDFIPKALNNNAFIKFWSICLCNFLYKIIAKNFANRLKEIFPQIISPNQVGFVLGHQILDGIITFHEVTHYSSNSKRDGMFLKLDVSKDYDKVD